MRKVLVVDVGGSHVKILVTGEQTARRFDSGTTMTPSQMVSEIKRLAAGWDYEVVTIGYPGSVSRNRITLEPHNLGPGWVGFDFAGAFDCPVKIINDAAMQALGSYHGGKMLFLGLGTGLGSALVTEDVVVPLEVAHLPYKKKTFEDYVGQRGLDKRGKRRWQRDVEDVVARLVAAFLAEEVVLGGGNVKKLTELPPHCRTGANTNAFTGGFRLWDNHQKGSAIGESAPDPT